MFSAEKVSAAIDRLRQLAPMAKPVVLAACIDTVLADEKLVAAEAEMLRTIAMALDCPVPLIVENAGETAAERVSASPVPA